MNTITEEQVIAWLNEAKQKLVAATGAARTAFISVTSSTYENDPATFTSYTTGGKFVNGGTLIEVIAGQVDARNPAHQAEQLRKEAAELIKKADALAHSNATTQAARAAMEAGQRGGEDQSPL